MTSIVTSNAGASLTSSTLTQHAVAVGNTATAVTSLAVGTNGQVLVGSTGADPAFATLTGTGGITFTTGANTLAINSTGGGLSWTTAGANANLVSNHGYLTDGGGRVTLTLPAASNVGDIITVTNIISGWQIAQLAGQQIQFGSQATTTGVTGNLQSTAASGDTVTIVCWSANTDWQVISSIGTIHVT